MRKSCPFVGHAHTELGAPVVGEIGKRSGNKTVLCLSFLCPCFAFIRRFSVVFCIS